jgi:uncharacterized membrane protein
VCYGVHQFAEIAARALSSGINDQFTTWAARTGIADALAEEDTGGSKFVVEGRPRPIE